MPYLPSSFTRDRLTAPSANVPGTSATAKSAFFTKLPPETRQRILVAAFGGRTVHMNLRLAAPLLPPSKRPLVPSTLQPMPHGGITADLEFGQWPKEVLDAAQRVRVTAPGTKPAWQWWGCVCHRNLPPGDERVVVAPWQDNCVRGYTEGIYVLFGTNTIFIGSGKLIEAVLHAASERPHPQRTLVPSHHLELLTRLELVWDWALFLRPENLQHQTAQRADMARSLGLLPQAFPNLVTLFISYSDALYHRSTKPDDCLDEIDHELLSPLSTMASHFHRLKLSKCIVELPTNTFRPLMLQAGRQGRKIDQGRSWQDVRFWWEPDGNTRMPENGCENADEDLPEETHMKGPSRAGFWVKSGVESDLIFDYLGQPVTLSTQPQTLH
ncbi:hypothetical protein SPI_03552 [Niveomyces insectorum RCEF 264]|uniref:Uncharacterized protein n=1 Tax=Niveomyces insectorum RCEF 264 TaxID=1081102 RepID=A0A167W695_9HYPO|nr:hypothetical protein SPI_03552 [Niveomyces insectorum RCEF 264]